MSKDYQPYLWQKRRDRHYPWEIMDRQRPRSTTTTTAQPKTPMEPTVTPESTMERHRRAIDELRAMFLRGGAVIVNPTTPVEPVETSKETVVDPHPYKGVDVANLNDADIKALENHRKLYHSKWGLGDYSLEPSYSGFTVFDTVLGRIDSNRRLVWDTCCGPVTNHNSSKYIIYMHFPRQLQESNEIEKWASFIKEHYGFNVKYVGTAPIEGSLYGGVNKFVDSHLIAIYAQSETTIITLHRLTAVTMLRYLYRPKHFKNIIKPIYEMVEMGINPWDALQLAHYYFILVSPDKDAYSGERGLSSGHYSLLYPRSYDHMCELFRGFNGSIHSVWQGIHPSTLCGINEYSYESTLLYRDYGFKNSLKDIFRKEGEYFIYPYETVFYKKFWSLLGKHDWMGAYELHRRYLVSKIPLLIALRDNFEYYKKITNKQNFMSTYGYGKLYNIELINHLIGFLKTL